MNEKKTFAGKATRFLAGRGFYIVLFACIAVIGVSAWALLAANPGDGTGGSYLDASTALTEADTEIFAPAVGPITAAPQLPATTPHAPLLPTPKPTEAAPTVAAPVPEPKSEPPKQEHGDTTAASIDDLTFARPLAGEITMVYAVDTLIYSRTMGDWRTHAAIDIAGALGAKVQAACDGTVEDIRQDDLLGTMVIVDHGFGLRSIYANLAAEPAVSKGESISLGAVIGAVGDTALGEAGEVTHLHFAMTLNGVATDPTKYLP